MKTFFEMMIRKEVKQKKKIQLFNKNLIKYIKLHSFPSEAMCLHIIDLSLLCSYTSFFLFFFFYNLKICMVGYLTLCYEIVISANMSLYMIYMIYI